MNADGEDAIVEPAESFDRVLERDGADLWVDLVRGELQLRALLAWREEGDALAEEDGHDGDLDGVHEVGVEEGAEEGAAAEEPDVLAFCAAEAGDFLFAVLTEDGDGGIVLLPEGAGADVDVHAGRRPATRMGEGFER